jgi:UDP-glucuronate 4-epimerase
VLGIKQFTCALRNGEILIGVSSTRFGMVFRAMDRVLVTGCAGFIGFHLSKRLLDSGIQVIGLDNLNEFYDGGLKSARLEILNALPGFTFVKADISDLHCINELFENEQFGPVIHLAAQAGVRYSLENPHLYVKTNLVGFVNLIEAAYRRRVPHFVYASSSSVYGSNTKTPFSECDNVDSPVSLYAATKKSNELIAHAYSHLHGLPSTGLRFFTVYGPWGRPDMAMFKFCRAILKGESIDVYNHGDMLRDFTYIDDVVEGIVRVMNDPPAVSGASAPVRVYNIGNNQPVQLMDVIRVIEEKIGKKAIVNMLPMQSGDVLVTYADIDRLSEAVGYRPHTPIEMGVDRFINWFRNYYHC